MCPECGSTKIVHIRGIKDFWLCFKCHTRLYPTKQTKEVPDGLPVIRKEATGG
jgi:ribosomal protein L37AE/L43A